MISKILISSVVLSLTVVISAGSGTAEAKTLYVVADTDESKILAYDIEGTDLACQADYDSNTDLAIAIAIDEDFLFITFENQNDIEVVNAKTMRKVDTVEAAGASNLAGIVADSGKQKVYVVDRGDKYLYVYDWYPNVPELVPVGDPVVLDGLIYSQQGGAWGLAIDEVNSRLYVTSNTTTVRYYDTDNNWSHNPNNDITVSHNAIGIAIDVENQILYSGSADPATYQQTLSKYDLTTESETTLDVTELTGADGDDYILGLAVDQDTGLLYATIGNKSTGGSERLVVFDSNLTLLWSSVDIGDPAGVAVAADVGYIPPFNPNKTDNIEDCVAPLGGQITYTISVDYQWTGYEDPNIFDSIKVVDYLPAEADFVSALPDNGLYNPGPDGTTYTWTLTDSNSFDDTKYFELMVQVNRKVPPAGKIENNVKVKAYIDNQEHIGSAKIETDVCDCTGYGKVIYVDIDADPGGDGTGWDKAFRKLQEGLAESWPCDEIWVAKSENAYKPTDDPCDVKATFSLVSGVGVYGGFLGGPSGEEDRYDRNWFDNETILSGDINGSAKVEYVVTSDANAPVSVLDGFTIKNGSMAGVYCEDSSPIIQHNKITASGSGIYCFDSDQPIIKNNWLYRNDNGIYIPKTYNMATVRNNTVANNENMGIYFDYGVAPVIGNCIIWGHPSDTNDLVGCTATYSCIEDGDEGTDNISFDPCFVSLVNDNYLLKAESLCIDAGDPDGDYGSQRDIDKHFRVLDGNGDDEKRIDMGADEYCNQGTDNIADFNDDDIVDTNDLVEMAAAWLIDDNDPCWAANYEKYDLNTDYVINYGDFAYFARQWLWMTCEKMQGYEMMETMMGMGAGESMLLGETAMIDTAAQASEAPPELSVEEQIEQIKYFLDWLYEIKDQVDEDTWLNLTASLEDMLKELEDSK